MDHYTYEEFLSAKEKADLGETLTDNELSCLLFWANANYR